MRDVGRGEQFGFARLPELIAGLPAEYETPLGKWFDKGSNLSGGEWPKVALSRRPFHRRPGCSFSRRSPTGLVVSETPTGESCISTNLADEG